MQMKAKWQRERNVTRKGEVIGRVTEGGEDREEGHRKKWKLCEKTGLLTTLQNGWILRNFSAKLLSVARAPLGCLLQQPHLAVNQAAVNCKTHTMAVSQPAVYCKTPTRLSIARDPLGYLLQKHTRLSDSPGNSIFPGNPDIIGLEASCYYDSFLYQAFNHQFSNYYYYYYY